MEELSKHIDIARLVAREVSESLSAEERIELDRWLEEKANQELYERIKANYVQGDKFARYNAFNVEAARKRVEWKIGHQKRVKTMRLYNTVLRYAAILILPLMMVGVMFYLFQKTSEDVQVAQEQVQIQPGTNKATLYLADGSKVDLEEKNIRRIQELDGTQIHKDSVGLRYESAAAKEEFQKPQYNVIVTPPGGEYFVTLSDGTKVWLNADTEMRYPVHFVGDTRSVVVQGEAYFEVTKNPKKPFVVNVGDLDIRVLGTSFNVMAYEDEENVETTLVEGAVRLIAPDQTGEPKTIDLKPGHQGNFKRSVKEFRVAEVNTSDYTAWKDGRLVFANESLESIMRKLQRWYNVKVFYQNPGVKDYHFSANMKRYGQIQDILDKISLTTNVEFQVKGNTVMVFEEFK